MSKPKVFMRQPAPGQSIEDFKREMEALYGNGEEATTIDASNMDAAELEKLLAGFGVDKDALDKKPGILQRIQNAILS